MVLGFMNSKIIFTIQNANQSILNIYYVLGDILGAADPVVSKSGIEFVIIWSVSK